MTRRAVRTLTSAFLATFLVAVFVATVSSNAHAQSVNNFVVPQEAAKRFTSSVRAAPLWIDIRQLAANVAETHTVPTNGKFVIFSGDCNFYARPNAVATVPSGDKTDGTGAELNPAAWYLNGVTTISVIAATACNISLSFYNGPTN